MTTKKSETTKTYFLKLDITTREAGMALTEIKDFFLSDANNFQTKEDREKAYKNLVMYEMCDLLGIKEKPSKVKIERVMLMTNEEIKKKEELKNN